MKTINHRLVNNLFSAPVRSLCPLSLPGTGTYGLHLILGGACNLGELNALLAAIEAPDATVALHPVFSEEFDVAIAVLVRVENFTTRYVVEEGD